MDKVLLDKTYYSEELSDVSRDVDEAFDDNFTLAVRDIPIDEHNFHRGKFRIQITWSPDDE